MSNPLSSPYQVERDKIAARPCQCVSCSDCHGTGTIWVWATFFEEPETCDNCRGSGITESCDRCNDLTELEEAYRDT